MKTISLLIAFGVAAQPALAQMTSPVPQSTESPSSTDMPPASSPSGSPSGMQPGMPMPSDSETSGASGTTGTSSSGASSGSQPGDISSGATNGMQSEAGAELRAPASPVATLEPKTQNDVTYLCGGVGEEEVAHMKQEAKGYDLMLTFATRKGEYLADVNVDIKDAKGNEVLQTTCNAPIMLVDLPKSGNYRIQADAAGYTLNQTARVVASERSRPQIASVVMNWPQRVAQALGDGTPSSGASGSSGTDSESRSGGTTGTDSGAR